MYITDLENLVELDLNYNSLTELVAGQFQYLIKLDELHLRGNQIETVNIDAFQGMHTHVLSEILQ